MSAVANARIQSQLNTPKEWIMNNRMFRIKSWEIGEDEIRSLIDSLVKHKYSLNLIRGKSGELKGITLLYLTDDNDVEIIRTSVLITSSGTELRKVSQFPKSDIASRTIKTTAPIWVTHARVYSIFSKYNTDPQFYDISMDHKINKSTQYPLIRFHPTIVDRDGKMTHVNVVYVEFSPNPLCQNDSFVALSMEHRTVVKNNISGEMATLIFDKWTVEKTHPISKKINVSSEPNIETKKKHKVKKIVERVY